MLRLMMSSTSWFSTRLRVLLVAHANSSVRPKPNSTKDRMMRVRRRRRWRGRRRGAALSAAAIEFRDAVADAMAGLDQRGVERLVDHLAQAVDVHAQAVRIGQFFAPDPGFQFLARDHRRAGLHQ